MGWWAACELGYTPSNKVRALSERATIEEYNTDLFGRGIRPVVHFLTRKSSQCDKKALNLESQKHFVNSYKNAKLRFQVLETKLNERIPSLQLM